VKQASGHALMDDFTWSDPPSRWAFAIASAGYPLLLGSAFITLVLALLGLTPLALAALVGTICIAGFFRDPDRVIPNRPGLVVSPADGRVICVERSRSDAFFDAEMTKISIFMSVFSVHINRAPVTGRIVDNFYVSGKFLDVRDERATFENERNGLVVETAAGLKLVVVQVAGLIARRIVCYPLVGQMMLQGQRYGLIRFGSRLDVYLPKVAVVQVTMGQKTVAGETILGILP